MTDWSFFCIIENRGGYMTYQEQFAFWKKQQLPDDLRKEIES